MYIILYNNKMINVMDIEKLLKSAKEGDKESQFFIGCCYYRGCELKQDYKQAIYW
jgi:TPR repeat protein